MKEWLSLSKRSCAMTHDNTHSANGVFETTFPRQQDLSIHSHSQEPIKALIV